MTPAQVAYQERVNLVHWERGLYVTEHGHVYLPVNHANQTLASETTRVIEHVMRLMPRRF